MSNNPGLEKTQEATTAQIIPSHEQDVEKTAVAQSLPITQPIDPNIVDWDGDDDPEKPINWPNSIKYRNIFVVSALTLLTPFGSTMVAPAVPQAMRTFNSDNGDLASFVVSVYVLGYAFGPLLIGEITSKVGIDQCCILIMNQHPAQRCMDACGSITLIPPSSSYSTSHAPSLRTYQLSSFFVFSLASQVSLPSLLGLEQLPTCSSKKSVVESCHCGLSLS